MTEEHSTVSWYAAPTLLLRSWDQNKGAPPFTDQVTDKAWYQGQHEAGPLLEYRYI